MRVRLPLIVLCCCWLCVAQNAAWVFGHENNAGSVVAIVNAASDLHEATSAELRRVFLGKANRIADHDVRAYTVDDTPQVTAKVREIILNMTDRDVKLFFLQEALKGGSKAPERVTDVDELIKVIKKDITGIAFVERQWLESSGAEGVKVLVIDGATVDDENYPLR